MLKYKYLSHILTSLVFCFFMANTYSQDAVIVKGQIVNGLTNAPLEGISVKELGTIGNPVVTNAQGEFSVQVTNLQATLRLEYPGLQAKNVPVNRKENLKLYMLAEGTSKLSEEVLLPYNKEVAQADVTSALHSKKAASLETAAVFSFEESIKGQFAGVNTISRSGKAGNGAIIDIRGVSTLYCKNQPLLVVDGVIFENTGFDYSVIDGFSHNVLADINPKDIVSMSVIKNGASIYGSKASNGVILIQTNKPNEAKTTIDAYVSSGIAFAPKDIPMLDASQHKNLLWSQFTDQGLSTDQVLSSYPFMNYNSNYYYINNYTNNTNWQKEVFNNSSTQDYFFSVKGGDETAKYALSVGYTDNNGIVKQTELTRFTIRLNGLLNITRKLEITPSLSYTNSNNDLMEDGISSTNIITSGLRKSPMFYPYIISHDNLPSAILSNIDEFGQSNPVAIFDKMKSTYTSNDFAGRIGLRYKFTPAFHLVSSFSVNNIRSSDDLYIPMYGVTNSLTDPGIFNTVKKGTYSYSSVQGELYAEYKKTYNQLHNITLLGGSRVLFSKIEKDVESANNTGSDLFTKLNNAADNKSTWGDVGNWNTLSTFVSASYNFNSKYYVTMNASLDGSSRIGRDATSLKIDNYPFGIFPSVEAAWRVSSEDFLKNLEMLDDLKLRLSYAITGNDDIGNYNNKYYYQAVKAQSLVGLTRGNIPNDKLKWETTSQLNAGVDVSLAKERVTLSVDVYSKQTKDLFLYQLPPAYMGVSDYANNDGKLTNKGIDIAVNVRILKGVFGWSVGANISKNNNKLASFSSSASYDLPTDNEIITIEGGEMINRQGSPMAQFYGYKTNGVFSTQQEAAEANLTNHTGVPFKAGDVRFLDTYEDHVIDYKDKQIIGNPFPKLYGGFSNEFTFKNFALRAQFAYSYGNDVFNNTRMNLESMKDLSNQTTAVLNRWTADGQVTNTPKSAYGDPMGNARFSDRWIEDGSYLRLSDLTLSYKFNNKFLLFRNATFYVTGHNLITFTKYLGYDPEFAYSSDYAGRGTDYGMTPQYKSVMAGLRIGL